jgi:hypothetical protein
MGRIFLKNHEKIICTRYDIEGIINPLELMYGLKYDEGFLHFFKSIDKPGYYIVMEVGKNDGVIWYHILNRTGKFDYGDGMPKARVEKPISLGIFDNNFRWRFKQYIIKNYSTDTYVQRCHSSSSWCKFEIFEPKKWFDEFIKIVEEKQNERIKKENIGKQYELF